MSALSNIKTSSLQNDSVVVRRLQQFGDQLSRASAETTLEATSLADHPRNGHTRLCLNPPLGEGYLESMRLPSGLVISRKDCALSRPMTSRYQQVSRTLGFSLILDGAFDVRIPQLSVCDRVQSGSVWVSSGRLASVTTRHVPGKRMTGIGLDLSPQMVEAWQEEAPEPLRRALRDALADQGGICAPYTPMTPTIQRLALKMLRCPTTSLCMRLEYESMALSLLASLLSMGDGGLNLSVTERRQARQKRLIAEALDILHAEWRKPPTIAQLAARVGMNECYLKVGFKDVVGSTIGQYVRGLRMEQARQLLAKQGYTVQQAALEVGFSNPSHFSAAFRSYFGHRPSEAAITAGH